MTTLSVSELLTSLTRLLSDKLDAGRIEIEILMAHALGWPRSRLYSQGDFQLGLEEQERIGDYINRRLRGEPVAYITGQQEFWSLKLKVNSHTLIPRPETEHLVEQALLKIPPQAAWRILDLGTGSGAIALSIARERPACQLTGVDISADSLAVAKDNQALLGVDNVHFLQSHWFDNLPCGQYDIIVSNPPYVANDDPHLQQGDLRFEPSQALASGTDGLDDIRHIIPTAKSHLKPGGWLLLEHGYQQAAAVQELFWRNGYALVETIADLAGNERVTFAQG